MKILVVLTLIYTSSLLANTKSICGTRDDRVPSTEPQIARALSTITASGGCTITMISSSCAISAGHCKDSLKIAEFNTPASIDGRIQHSKNIDVYNISQAGKTVVYEGLGEDWAVMKLEPNKITGLLAGDAQGFYNVSFEEVSIGDQLRITGYGLDRKDPERNLAQQSHIGTVVRFGSYEESVMYHNTDTMGGNSGSSIVNLRTGNIVAIHTNGGCNRRTNSGENASTLINKRPELVNAIKACLASER